jgi:hypothetical protein
LRFNSERAFLDREDEKTKETQLFEIEISYTGIASISIGVSLQWAGVGFGMDD